MAYPKGLSDHIDYHKRRYRKNLRDLEQMIRLELECLADADENFTPSTAIESQFLQAAQINQMLHTLNEAQGLLDGQIS